MTERQMRTLLAHELAHVRRGDVWTRWFEIMVTGLYWWFPVLWWARRELQHAEEVCCDAWVLWAYPEDSKEYARALLDTIDFLAESRPAMPQIASGLGQVFRFKRRFQMILDGQLMPTLSGLPKSALVCFALLVLPWAPGVSQDDASGDATDRRAENEAGGGSSGGDATEGSSGAVKPSTDAGGDVRTANAGGEYSGGDATNADGGLSRFRGLTETTGARSRTSASDSRRDRTPRQFSGAGTTLLGGGGDDSRTQPAAEIGAGAFREGLAANSAQDSRIEQRLSRLEAAIETILNEVQSLKRQAAVRSPRRDGAVARNFSAGGNRVGAPPADDTATFGGASQFSDPEGHDASMTGRVGGVLVEVKGNEVRGADPRSGELLWATKLPSQFPGRPTTLSVKDQTISLVGEGSVVELDSRTGNIIGRTQGGFPSRKARLAQIRAEKARLRARLAEIESIERKLSSERHGGSL